MKKKYLIFIFYILIEISCFGQQSEPISNSFIDLLENKDVFLNRKLINPTNLTDSNNYFIDLGLQVEWIGSSDQEFFASGETYLPAINSSIGLNIDFRNIGYFKHHSLIASYKYSFEINNESNFDFGINLGIWQYKNFESEIYLEIPDFYITEETEWVNSPIIDFGISYKFKKHNLRLSYNNLINSKMELGESGIFLRSNGVIANYQNSFNLNEKLSITPEIFGCFNTKSQYGILTCKLNYANLISGGLLYNTENSIGFYFHGLIKNRFMIGFLYEIENIKDIQRNGNPNTLKFGIIL